MTGNRAAFPADWPWKDNWISIDQLREGPPVAVEAAFYFIKVQKFIENLLGGTEDWEPPPFFSEILWGLTGSGVLNSEARITSTGKYAIALDAIAPIQLMDTFYRLLANPSVLCDIGDAPREPFVPQALLKYPPIIKGAQSKDQSDVVAIRAGSTKAPPMGNQRRVNCVSFLTYNSLQFMYMHELAHIVEGHTGYIDAHFLNSPDEKRGLEYRADAIAATTYLTLPESLRGKPRDGDPLIKKEQFRLWGFAICTWFLLLESFKDQAVSSEGYPMASVRSLLVNGAIGGGPPTYNEFTRDEVLAAVTRGFREAHKAWEDMGWGVSQSPTEVDRDQAMEDIFAWGEGRLKPFAQEESIVDAGISTYSI
jgi:hypothetical protein